MLWAWPLNEGMVITWSQARHGTMPRKSNFCQNSFFPWIKFTIFPEGSHRFMKSSVNFVDMIINQKQYNATNICHIDELSSNLTWDCLQLMPSPSAFSKFVLSVLKFLGIVLKFLRCTQNSLGILKWANLHREI